MLRLSFCEVVKAGKEKLKGFGGGGGGGAAAPVAGGGGAAPEAKKEEKKARGVTLSA